MYIAQFVSALIHQSRFISPDRGTIPIWTYCQPTHFLKSEFNRQSSCSNYIPKRNTYHRRFQMGVPPNHPILDHSRNKTYGSFWIPINFPYVSWLNHVKAMKNAPKSHPLKILAPVHHRGLGFPRVATRCTASVSGKPSIRPPASKCSTNGIESIFYYDIIIIVWY